MKQVLFRHLSLHSQFSLSQSLKPLASLSSKTDIFAANFSNVRETNSARTQKEVSFADNEDVSNEELRRRIEKYFEGDEEAIPSIFEAILKRKLAGKHDESDNELLEEFRDKPVDNDSDKEFDSDEDEL